jgi:hypothetical protein
MTLSQRRIIGSKSVKRRGKLANRSADHPPDAVSWANEISFMKNGGSDRAKRKATLEKKNTGRIIVATTSF